MHTGPVNIYISIGGQIGYSPYAKSVFDKKGSDLILFPQKGDRKMAFFLTVAAASAFGFLFLKKKVPGGVMVGALMGTVLLNISTGQACMPAAARTIAQITAGAFIGASIRRSDVQRMPKLAKPAVILLSSMLVLNLILGVVIHAISGLDWMTSFFCAVPGGMSDTPIIAAEMGADGGAVAFMQFFRLLGGVGVFPTVIMMTTRHEEPAPSSVPQKVTAPDAAEPSVPAAVITAAVCGIIGKLSGIPVGTLIFSMCGTAALGLMTGRAAIPMYLKRIAQVLSGAYIGSSIGLQGLLDLRHLVLSACLLVAAYLLNCFFVSGMLHRFCGMTRREALLVSTPAGATDMALISGDMGISSLDLNVLQIIRMITVVTIFPQIIRLAVLLLGLA